VKKTDFAILNIFNPFYYCIKFTKLLISCQSLFWAIIYNFNAEYFLVFLQIFTYEILRIMETVKFLVFFTCSYGYTNQHNDSKVVINPNKYNKFRFLETGYNIYITR
jgi:hypothetical protein